jgi:hypothetical protein
MTKVPRREVVQEFYTNVLNLGKMAKAMYIKEIREGTRAPNFTALRELELNIETIERELEKYK